MRCVRLRFPPDSTPPYRSSAYVCNQSVLKEQGYVVLAKRRCGLAKRRWSQVAAWARLQAMQRAAISVCELLAKVGLAGEAPRLWFLPTCALPLF